MRSLSFLLALLLLGCGPVLGSGVPQVSAPEAARQVAAGTAVLVDVREPAEWADTGVAAPAVLLAKSSFDAELSGGWKSFLEQHRGREIILYCRSGNRSGQVAAALAAQGYQVANAGGFKEWQAAGLPVRLVAAPAEVK